VLVRNVLISVDPYMRGRMTGIRTYVPGFEVGDVIEGQTVGRVVASRDDRMPRATGCARCSAGATQVWRAPTT
jgi:Putative NADP-dependent oxidoreductases